MILKLRLNFFNSSTVSIHNYSILSTLKYILDRCVQHKIEKHLDLLYSRVTPSVTTVVGLLLRRAMSKESISDTRIFCLAI